MRFKASAGVGGVVVCLAALGRLLVHCGRSCGASVVVYLCRARFLSAGRSAVTIAAAVAGRVVVGFYACARKKLEKRRFYLVGASSSCGRRSVIAAGGCSRGAVMGFGVGLVFFDSLKIIMVCGFCLVVAYQNYI